MNETTRWREAYAAASPPDPHAGGVCLDVDELLAALDGKLVGERLEHALTALAVCPRCAVIAQIAADLRGESDPLADDDAQRSVRPVVRARVRQTRWPWAAAAIVVLGIAALVPPLLRTPAEMPVRAAPGSQYAQPANGSKLRNPPERLVWRALEGAPRYRVDIYDESANLLWRSDALSQSEVLLPAPLRLQLRQGTFLWRARVEGSGNEVGPFHFSVAP